MIQLHSSILYSLSDSSLATAFSTLLGQNVQVFHSNLVNFFGALQRINNFFCLNSAKCLFCSVGPIVKFAHCQQTDSTISRVCIVGDGQILQWDLWAKSTICGVETKRIFIHTRSSAPKRFAKFGWKTWTFCPPPKWKKRLPNSSQTDYSSIHRVL